MGGWCRGLRGFVLLCFRGEDGGRGGALGAKSWATVEGVAATRDAEGEAGPELPLSVEALHWSRGSSGVIPIARRAWQQEAVSSPSWVSISLASTASSWVT